MDIILYNLVSLLGGVSSKNNWPKIKFDYVCTKYILGDRFMEIFLKMKFSTRILNELELFIKLFNFLT